jgi:hypothetical protein
MIKKKNKTLLLCPSSTRHQKPSFSSFALLSAAEPVLGQKLDLETMKMESGQNLCPHSPHMSMSTSG